MAEINREMGKSVCDALCSTLTNLGLHFQVEENQDDFTIRFGLKGKDMNHDVVLVVNMGPEVVQIFERLPFNIDPEKSLDIAAATCYVNDHILLGCFQYNMQDRLCYMVSQAYGGSLLGEAALKRMVLALVFTVEEYDDKFMALNKGYIKPEEFKN